MIVKRKGAKKQRGDIQRTRLAQALFKKWEEENREKVTFQAQKKEEGMGTL